MQGSQIPEAGDEAAGLPSLEDLAQLSVKLDDVDSRLLKLDEKQPVTEQGDGQ